MPKLLTLALLAVAITGGMTFATGLVLSAAHAEEGTQSTGGEQQGGQVGVIAESVPNPTLSGIEEHRARIAEGPEAVLERFRWPNVVAIEGDVFPAERRDMSNVIIGNDLAA